MATEAEPKSTPRCKREAEQPDKEKKQREGQPCLCRDVLVRPFIIVTVDNRMGKPLAAAGALSPAWCRCGADALVRFALRANIVPVHRSLLAIDLQVRLRKTKAGRVKHHGLDPGQFWTRPPPKKTTTPQPTVVLRRVTMQ